MFGHFGGCRERPEPTPPSAVAMTSHETMVLTYRVPEELLAEGAEARLQAWAFGALATALEAITSGRVRRCAGGRTATGYRIDFAVEDNCPEVLATIVETGPLAVCDEWVDLAWQATVLPVEVFGARR